MKTKIFTRKELVEMGLPYEAKTSGISPHVGLKLEIRRRLRKEGFDLEADGLTEEELPDGGIRYTQEDTNA